jgi:hypothetical protein
MAHRNFVGPNFDFSTLVLKTVEKFIFLSKKLGCKIHLLNVNKCEINSIGDDFYMSFTKQTIVKENEISIMNIVTK